MERKTYYNPLLDPHCQAKMTPKMRAAVIADSYAEGGPLHEGLDAASYPINLISSLCDDGMHRPALDIDVPCRYVPSSTEGHGHLYFDTIALSWEAYVDLLCALATAGIVDAAYVEHSIARKQTLLRPPGVSK